MSLRRLLLPAAALLIGMAPAAARPVPCDRICLDAIADAYVAALAARDPARLPLARRVLFSENLVPLPIGSAGLWRTATGRRGYAIHASDETTGQANWIGVVEEMGKPVFLAVRLKVADRRIVEAETLVGRSPLDGAGKVGAPRESFARAEPPGRRLDRAALVALVEAHWDAMESGIAWRENYAADCTRFDNGVRTTGTAPDPAPGSGPPANLGALGCHAQLASGMFVNGNRVDPRRIWGVDVERGLVIGLFTPNVPGDAEAVTVFGKSVPTGPGEREPFTIAQVELFKIANGRIQDVEVVFGPRVPFGMRSPFDRAAAPESQKRSGEKK